MMFERLANFLPQWAGSTTSLALHTIFFLGFFALLLAGVDLDTVLLALTTLISVEAIYLALFIQRSVNQNTQTLEDVEEDIEDIGEDIGEIESDIDTIQLHDQQEDAHDAQHEADMDKLEQEIAELKQMVSNLQAELNAKEGSREKARNLKVKGEK